MIQALKKAETKGVFNEYLLELPLVKNIPDKNETNKYFYNSTENILKKEFDS